MCDISFTAGLQDLQAGTMAGIGQLLVGHPFDTVKVITRQMPIPCSPKPFTVRFPESTS